MKFTLRQLAYFQALATARTFGAAAERMHVTQPALSMQIRELEAAMGGALVERLPREVRLTPRGRVVLEQASRILGEARELDAFARRGLGEEQINLGVIPTAAPYLLPGVLDRVAAGGLPALRVREAQTELLVAALVQGQLDAVLIARPARDPRMVAEDLFEDRFLLAAHARRLARLGVVLPALHPEDLDPEQLLLLDEGHCLAGRIDRNEDALLGRGVAAVVLDVRVVAAVEHEQRHDAEAADAQLVLAGARQVDHGAGENDSVVCDDVRVERGVEVHGRRLRPALEGVQREFGHLARSAHFEIPP